MCDRKYICLLKPSFRCSRAYCFVCVQGNPMAALHEQFKAIVAQQQNLLMQFQRLEAFKNQLLRHHNLLQPMPQPQLPQTAQQQQQQVQQQAQQQQEQQLQQQQQQQQLDVDRWASSIKYPCAVRLTDAHVVQQLVLLWLKLVSTCKGC